MMVFEGLHPIYDEKAGSQRESESEELIHGDFVFLMSEVDFDCNCLELLQIFPVAQSEATIYILQLGLTLIMVRAAGRPAFRWFSGFPKKV